MSNYLTRWTNHNNTWCNTCWEILGCQPTHSQQVIIEHYRSRANILHPDKPSGNHEYFLLLQQAKATALEFASLKRALFNFYQGNTLLDHYVTDSYSATVSITNTLSYQQKISLTVPKSFNVTIKNGGLAVDNHDNIVFCDLHVRLNFTPHLHFEVVDNDIIGVLELHIDDIDKPITITGLNKQKITLTVSESDDTIIIPNYGILTATGHGDMLLLIQWVNGEYVSPHLKTLQ